MCPIIRVEHFADDYAITKIDSAHQMVYYFSISRTVLAGNHLEAGQPLYIFRKAAATSNQWYRLKPWSEKKIVKIFLVYSRNHG